MTDDEMKAEAATLVDAALNGDPEALKELVDSFDGDEDDDQDSDSSSDDAGRPVTLNVVRQEGESLERAAARIALKPEIRASVTSLGLMGAEQLFADGVELSELVAELEAQVNAVKSRDLGRGEAMLVAQTHTLDALFNFLVRKATSAEYLSQYEALLKLALRAQSQCRSTWEAISSIQNPPVAGYVKQANIAHNQQVNNAPCAEEIDKPPSKLLEQTDHEPDQWLDTGAPTAAERVDSQVEALGEIHGPSNSRGEG
jgi:hypothetical protein